MTLMDNTKSLPIIIEPAEHEALMAHLLEMPAKYAVALINFLVKKQADAQAAKAAAAAEAPKAALGDADGSAS